jgi:hypothetical protein
MAGKPPGGSLEKARLDESAFSVLARPQVGGQVSAVVVRTPYAYGRSPLTPDATGFAPDAVVWASHGRLRHAGYAHHDLLLF